MITKFNKFNEGVLNSKYDKYVKDFFEEIKKEFDYDNLELVDHYPTFIYRHDGIKLEISEIDFFKMNLFIDNKLFDCSFSLKRKILNYFKKMKGYKKPKSE